MTIGTLLGLLVDNNNTALFDGFVVDVVVVIDEAVVVSTSSHS